MQPSDLEMQVLSILWRDGAKTVRELLDRIPDGKVRSYTTVLTVMQVMEKKGFVTHSNRGKSYVYHPAITRKQVLRPMLRGLVTKLFGGSTSDAVLHLIAETDVSADELAEIRTLLDAAKERPPNND